MILKQIQVTNELTNFSEHIDLDLIISEYKNNGTINHLFNAIIAQENQNYSFNFRYNYYNNLLNHIGTFSKEEKEIIVLLCIIKSYKENLNSYIDEIMNLYKIIDNYNYENKYFNFIKYQIDFQLFSYYVFETNEKEITLILKEKVDKGNIDFKNY